MKRTISFLGAILLVIVFSFVFASEALAEFGSVRWGDNGVHINRPGDVNTLGEMVSDGAGGVIMVWHSYTEEMDYDIYAQRFDSQGNELWGENGIPICNELQQQRSSSVISDGNGGAIISWEDGRWDPDQPNIYAQRISSRGDILWEENGVIVCADPKEQFSPWMVSDGNSGAVIAWYDRRHVPPNDHSAIYAQRINNQGERMWPGDHFNGIPVYTINARMYRPKMISDSEGGAIIVWADDRFGFEHSNVYGQRIDSEGRILWDHNGEVISDAVHDQFLVDVVSDGQGGAYVAWHDERWSEDGDIYGQRIDAQGNGLWDLDGIALCFAIGEQFDPELIQDGQGGFIVVWQDGRINIVDLYAEKFNSDGQRQWSNNGVPVAVHLHNQLYHQVVSDGDGGAIITWNDSRNGFMNDDVFMQKIDSDGEIKFPITGRALTNRAGRQQYPEIVADGKNGAIIVWSETDDQWQFQGVFLQRIEGSSTWYLAEGSTEGFDEWVSIQNPNDQESELLVTFMRSEGREPVEREMTVAANSRATIHVNTILPNESISTKVESTNGVSVVAERVMYKSSGRYDWIMGHCSVGVTQPNSTWYLAEGSTEGLDEWISIQNPNDQESELLVTFMRSEGREPVQREMTVAANSRATIHVNTILPNESISTKVEATNGVGIVAERVMYRNSGGIDWSMGHCSVGVTQPNSAWYLAEGSTEGFDEWVLMQNPNDEEAEVLVTFMRSEGRQPVERELTLEANSRTTIHVNAVLPEESISTKVESTNGVSVIAERAMYRNSGGITWVMGHCSRGETE